jgi:hypothetical protein
LAKNPPAFNGRIDNHDLSDTVPVEIRNSLPQGLARKNQFSFAPSEFSFNFLRLTRHLDLRRLVRHERTFASAHELARCVAAIGPYRHATAPRRGVPAG